MNILLTRDQFRTQVFKRDKNKCVVCSEPGMDVHHLIERKLWRNGGYYVDNGVTLCSECHIRAESTHFSIEFLRECAEITSVVEPENFSGNKWGKPVKYQKYPKTMHLYWSPNLQNEDRLQSSADFIEMSSKPLILTIKLDGENTSLYNDHIHARSLDSKDHPSRSWLKQKHAEIKYKIPPTYRICGENMFAKHSIHYTDLESYFYIFGVFDGDKCLDWEDVQMWADELGFPTVPVVMTFKANVEYLEWYIHSRHMMCKNQSPYEVYVEHSLQEVEGYVIRNVMEFSLSEWSKNIAKYVRKNHIQTDKNWMTQPVVKNLLKENNDP